MEYTQCDQCVKRCPVEHLRCENGFRRYKEITGKDYIQKDDLIDQKGSGDAYRRKILERRAQKSLKRD